MSNKRTLAIDWANLTGKDVAAALGVGEDAVDHWSRSDNCPGPPYNLAEIWKWRLAKELDKAAPAPSGAESEEALERKRHWDAENARLKNEILKGKLLDKEEVLKSVAEAAYMVRSALCNVGSELSVALSRTHDALEIREMIDHAIYEKLGGLQLGSLKVDVESEDE